MTLLNLIFVSSLQRADGNDLPAILARAVLHNQSTSVRSMVLFSAGNVMQAIDGEASEIQCEKRRLFQCADYLDSIVLNEEEVAGPTLSGNSLGASHLSPTVIEMLPANVAFFGLSERGVVQRVRLGIARNLLRQFAADYA
jgi:hypothetical protein